LESTGCLQGHRFQKLGGSTGPDLTSVATRLDAQKILESIIEPSRVIAEQFANVEITTTVGHVYVGRLEQENDERLVLRTVAKPDSPISIERRHIEERCLSRISNMPTGTVNSLTKTQILDLLMDLISNGQSDHSAFEPGD